MGRRQKKPLTWLPSRSSSCRIVPGRPAVSPLISQEAARNAKFDDAALRMPPEQTWQQRRGLCSNAVKHSHSYYMHCSAGVWT